MIITSKGILSQYQGDKVHPEKCEQVLQQSKEWNGKGGSKTDSKDVFIQSTGISAESLKNVETIRDRMNHTIVKSVTLFSDTRAGILKEAREEKGHYNYSDVVNAVGLSYAKIYSEIDERYENRDALYYDVDGTLLTKEDEIEWLNQEYENEVKWQKACADIAAQREVFLGHISAAPTKEIEQLEECFYQAKDTYMKRYQENKQLRKPLTLQNYMFGNRQIYEKINPLGKW